MGSEAVVVVCIYARFSTGNNEKSSINYLGFKLYNLQPNVMGWRPNWQGVTAWGPSGNAVKYIWVARTHDCQNLEAMLDLGDLARYDSGSKKVSNTKAMPANGTSMIHRPYHSSQSLGCSSVCPKGFPKQRLLRTSLATSDCVKDVEAPTAALISACMYIPRIKTVSTRCCNNKGEQVASGGIV